MITETRTYNRKVQSQNNNTITITRLLEILDALVEVGVVFGHPALFALPITIIIIITMIIIMIIISMIIISIISIISI